MPETPSTEPLVTASGASAAQPSDGAVLVEESLVEEVSIDGMCGVY